MVFVPIFISDILNGKWEGSKFKSFNGEILDRVSITGYILSKEDRNKYTVLYVNDGTGTIQLRVFSNQDIDVSEIKKGDIIVVLGRIREFRGETYVNPLKITKLKNEYVYLAYRSNILQRYYRKRLKLPKMFERKEEKKEEEGKEQKVIEEIKENAFEGRRLFEDPEVAKIAEYRRNIIRLIEDLDEGEGADIEKIFELSGIPNRELFDMIVRELLMTGEIYEVYPGKVKLLK